MSESLMKFSNALAETVQTAASAVVRVEARRRLPATGIVWSADGVILTANHVVQNESDIRIGLPDGSMVPATLAGRDPSTDLAVLRAAASDLKPLPHADEEALGVGHLVLALGRPGQTVQATFGIISASGGSWQTRGGGQIERYLQTDVVMYPGFSGGPLVGAGTQLLGLNTSALMPGVSLALPTLMLQRVADALLAHGRLRRGYLGVSLQRVRLPEALQEQLEQRSGLLIIGVESGSPAEAGGLTLGDTIVAVADVPVRRHDDLMAQLSGERVGQKTPITILRGGELRTLNVAIGEREVSERGRHQRRGRRRGR